MAITTSTLSDTIKATYERRLLSRALPRMLHAKWATRARLTKSNTYEVRKFSSMPNISTPLTEGVTPAEGSAPTISKINLTPLWYGSWVSYTDQLELQNFDPVISETTGILGEQCGMSFDVMCRDNLVAGATIDYAGSATARDNIDTTNDKLDYGDFVGAVATLKIQNAMPAEGQLFPVVLHPYSWAELMQDTTFVALFTNSTPEVIRTGQMGTILDCAIYVSSNAKTWTDAGTTACDVHTALFFGAESYAIAGMSGVEANLVQDSGGEYSNQTGKPMNPVSIIVKDLGETGLDPLNQRGTIGWKATYDDAILNSSWLLSLEHTTMYD